MKSGRTISIKSDKLKKIRNNLRNILLCEAINRQANISKEEKKVLFDEFGKIIISKDRSKTDNDLLGKFQDEWWKLERLKRKSICECSYCRKTDSDMTYYSKEWICSECYQSNRH